MKIQKNVLVSALVSSALFIILPVTALAATYNVDPTGNDGNACTAPGASACLTVQGAVNKAAGGDTIDVAAGTYSGNIIIPAGLTNLTIQGSGSVVFNLGSGYGVNLDNGAAITGFTLSGFTFNSSSGTTYAFKAYKADGLTLTNDTFNGNGFGGGVDINTTSHVTLNSVTATGFHKNGFAVTSAYTVGDQATPSSDITFNNITASNNGWTGVSFYTIGNDHSPSSIGGSASISGMHFTGTDTISGNGGGAGNGTGMHIEGDSDANEGSLATPSNTVTSDGTTLDITHVAFSGNVHDDIVNYQTAPVNAIGATFGGLTGDAMTSPQRTTEDGLIVDQLDHANLGLVSYYTLAAVTTDAATDLALTSATVNGTNGPTAADNTSFWWGTTPIVGTLTPGADPGSTEFPAGWSHDSGVGSVGTGGAFNESLTGLTSGQTYYFVAWVHIGGIWYPGEVLSFTAPLCNTNATETIVSDTATQDATDAHAAVAVTPHPAWTSIPGATWVYSDALDGNGSSPTGTKTFTRAFNIVGTPQDSTLQIAADNMYTVSVNGNPISTGTSATDLNNFSASQTWNIPAADLLSGSNTVTFTVTNPAVDPVSQVPFSDPNPAGLDFKLTVSNNECLVPTPPTPTVTTNSATSETLSTATLNGTDGSVAGDNTSFWWGTTAPVTPITTPGADPASTGEFPAGWTHDSGLGPIGAGGAFNEPLSGLTPGAKYYFVAWVRAGGIWYPGETLSFIEPVSAPQCPANTTLSSSPTDTFSVNSNSSTATAGSINLTSGQPYIVTASGTWQNTNLNAADAGFSSTDSWASYMEGYDIAPYFLGPQEFALQVNGQFVNWGPYDGASHTYSTLLTGAGTPVTLGVFDGDSNANTANAGWYGDNTGSLSVNVYACIPTTGTISGEKFNDKNRNGKLDAGEPGLQGWTIRLEDTHNHVIATTVTDASGNYTFTNVVPGTYKVREVHQNGWDRQTKNPKPIVIIGGSVVGDVDFGNATTKRGEHQDNDQDDQRDDQSGNYYANHGHSDYGKDQNSQNHQQPDNSHGQQGNDNGHGNNGH